MNFNASNKSQNDRRVIHKTVQNFHRFSYPNTFMLGRNTVPQIGENVSIKQSLVLTHN